MLNERRVAMLLAAAEHGSFARAAAALSFTPSGVSQQMGLLERDAGATLFERGPAASGSHPPARRSSVTPRACATT